MKLVVCLITLSLLLVPTAAMAQTQAAPQPGASVTAAVYDPPPPLVLPSQMPDAQWWPQWADASITDAVLWGIIAGMPSDNGYTGEPDVIWHDGMVLAIVPVVGTPGPFDPSGTLTKAQFAVMLAAAAGMRVPDPQEAQAGLPPGVRPGQWYTNAVQALAGAGIIDGSNAFNPSQPLSRYEAAVWMGRALTYFGVQGQGSAPNFSDVAATSPNYQAFVVAYEAGVIHGFPGNTFEPQGTLTRAQAAALVVGFVQRLPGYAQLAMQTPELPRLIAGYLYYAQQGPPGAMPPGGFSDTTCPYPTATMATNADVPFTPATTDAGLAQEPYATWQQIHEWIATANWIALGEAKYTDQQAQYIAAYGLQPWQVEMVALAAGGYPWGTENHMEADFPLINYLWPAESSSDQPTGTPLTNITLYFADHPDVGGDTGEPGSIYAVYSGSQSVVTDLGIGGAISASSYYQVIINNQVSGPWGQAINSGSCN